MALKIISLNTRGLSEVIKRRMIFNYYRSRADIICLQEIHSDETIEKIWTSEWGGKILFSHGSTSVRGVCISFKKNIKYKINKSFKDTNGRLIGCEIESEEIPGRILTIANIYAPNKDKPNFFVEVIQSMADCDANQMIIGDFNLVIDVNMDRKGSTYNNIKAREALQVIMDELFLIDVWRVRNSNEREYSWMRTGRTISASRIDYALTSQSVSANVVNTMYLPGIRSDHRAFFVAVDITKIERGRGFWKFNNQLLQNKEFVLNMNNYIEEIKKEADKIQSKTIKWDFVRIKMTEFSKSYSKDLAEERTLIVAQLSEKILELNKEIDNENNYNTKKVDLLNKTQADMEDILEEKAKSSIFRAKCRWQELGEVNSKFFFNLEKARYNARTYTKLIDEDSGKDITGKDEVLKYQEKYYRNLYKSENIEFVMDKESDIKVPEEMKKRHELPFTQEEIGIAIKQLKNGRTPGSNGLTTDFYKMFYSRIGKILFEAITEMHANQKITDSMSRGIINLIPKGQKDARFLKFARPICLLNIEYKIVEKAISNRMSEALDIIIHTDQKGFMKGRRLAVNVRKIYDIMKHCEEKDLQAIILSLDFEKCLDKIAFSAITGSMKHFGFAEYLINWTKIMYSNFTAVIQNNGFFSNVFPIQKGVHQGAPASSMYFLLCAEILATQLRNDCEIKGIPVKEIFNLLGQYADDMDIYSLFDQSSLDRIFIILENFKRITGFTVNYEKTNIYRIGSLKQSDARLIMQRSVNWTNHGLKVLGIEIRDKEKDALEANYGDMLEKIRGILKLWGSRNLSIVGKVNIINTLIASLFVHKMMVLPNIKKSSIDAIEKEFEKFIWNGRRPKIPLKTLMKSKKAGGLNLVDLTKKEIALKSTWVEIAMSDKQVANFAYNALNTIIEKYIWICQLDVKDIDVLWPNHHYSFGKMCLNPEQ